MNSLPDNAKEIPFFPGYYATLNGKIWSGPKRNYHGYRQLKLHLQQDGYLRVYLRRLGNTHPQKVSRLVLETFVGPCPRGMECCHGDGDRVNNILTNLRWDTRSNNAKERFIHGTQSHIGENHPQAKLIASQVLKIRALATAGKLKQCEIATFFGVHTTTVCDIVRRKSWSHLIP